MFLDSYQVLFVVSDSDLKSFGTALFVQKNGPQIKVRDMIKLRCETKSSEKMPIKNCRVQKKKRDMKLPLQSLRYTPETNSCSSTIFPETN